MYSYTFDPETGGIILNSTPTNFSKEPRPVYSTEMDILGFNKYWEYDKQNDVPYMWAESNVYWYRGVQIAKLRGGDLYTSPELQPAYADDGSLPFSSQKNNRLLPIDIEAMCSRNEDLLSVIEDSTVKKIVKEYEKFKDKLDIFHVAFSGGKDSAVLLDLVKKALPMSSFVVIFGDTGMEFPDTYEAVEKAKRQCEEDETPFYIARSHFSPEESWELFGPPSRTLRWCCSVHKSTPQTLKMREITGKNNYTGLDFVGVRKHESLARSTYEYENYGKKQKGQHSYNPLLEWTSAEIWLYIFARGIYINKAYKKGNSRAGCLLCPMSGGCSDYIRRYNYTDEIERFIAIIKRKNNWDNYSDAELHSYVTSGGWDNRRSGRGIAGNTVKFKEVLSNGVITIEIKDPHASWKEWLKTADIVTIPVDIKETSDGAVFQLLEKDVKAHPAAGKIIRQSLRKAAYCVGCRVCETNCKQGHIRFENGRAIITDCIQCHECHDIPGGCHVFNSLKMPQGEKKMKTINCFDDHAPKRDWMVSFFELQDDFFEDNTLGPNMFTHFKRFLRDAKLIDGNKCTNFSSLICDLGWETDTALGLMLVNLAYENAQFDWYITQMDTGYYYESSIIKERLLAEDMKEKAANSVVKSFKRIATTPFGTVLNFCYVTDDDDMVRTKCSISDNKVILYALYKFAEKCNLDKEFNVSYLYDDTIERDGVSPVRIFGLTEEEELRSILLGLSSAYPDYINATFTNDLQTITLRDKTSDYVLNLFKEDR